MRLLTRKLVALVVILDLAFMAVNFSALTLFSALAEHIIKALHLSRTLLWWSLAAYPAGIFAAFFAGHSRFAEEHPRLMVLLGGVVAGLPQLVTPFSPPYIIPLLRFLQGMVMMALPVFAAQTSVMFKGARPLALGIILSGIFIGGFVGEATGPILSQILGWRLAYIAYGLLMLVFALIWLVLTPKETLPQVQTESVMPSRRVWGHVFTVVWGLSFFPAIWVIFTLAPMVRMLLEEGFHVPLLEAARASRVLEASYTVWSIVIGLLAYYLVRNVSGDPRKMFVRIALVQAVCYVTAFVGFITLLALGPNAVVYSMILIGVIQGTGPTFWSIPPTVYPREQVTRAGYALGLISNSAALIGPSSIAALSSLNIVVAWTILALACIAGLLTTLISVRLRLPLES